MFKGGLKAIRVNFKNTAAGYKTLHELFLEKLMRFCEILWDSSFIDEQEIAMLIGWQHVRHV